MRAIGFGVLLGGVALLSSPLLAVEPAQVRPGALLEEPGRFLGRTVEVDIVEALHGPATPERLASAEYGQVRIAIPDSGGRGELSLVPASWRPGDPDRYRRRFDRVLTAPIRVRGELIEDEELRRGDRRSYVIRVESIAPLALPAPIRVAAVAELLADRERFDRATIEIEGTHESRFEVSALEKEIWLSRAPDARVLGTPGPAGKPQRVRVVGTLFSKPGARYGHLGGYPLMLVAREIEYR